jgi:hypothetical protein
MVGMIRHADLFSPAAAGAVARALLTETPVRALRAFDGAER